MRVYAPIGNHRDLLPYLVRRLLENGANSSFVNRFLDQQTPVEELLEDTRKQVTGCFPYQHKGIPVPPEMFRAVGEERKNAHGIDLDSVLEAEQLLGQIAKTPQLLSQPIIDGVALDQSNWHPSYKPQRPDPADWSQRPSRVMAIYSTP